MMPARFFCRLATRNQPSVLRIRPLFRHQHAPTRVRYDLHAVARLLEHRSALPLVFARMRFDDPPRIGFRDQTLRTPEDESLGALDVDFYDDRLRRVRNVVETSEWSRNPYHISPNFYPRPRPGTRTSTRTIGSNVRQQYLPLCGIWFERNHCFHRWLRCEIQNVFTLTGADIDV